MTHATPTTHDESLFAAPASAARATHLGAHRADGTDDLGEALPITIRIGADGRLYFHDVTAAFLPIVAALGPDDPAVRLAIEAAELFSRHALPNTRLPHSPRSMAIDIPVASPAATKHRETDGNI